MQQQGISLGRRALDLLLVTLGSAGLTLLCFGLLPVIQQFTERPLPTHTVRAMDTSALPPPPPVMEEEPEPEPEPEEPPPQLEEQTELLDLSQLEAALNSGLGGGSFGAGSFNLDLGSMMGQESKAKELFSAADLDQKPRAIYRSSPRITAKMRKKAPGTVNLIFIVDESGRVQQPVVRSASDPIFEKAALAAIKQWRFEPGKRNGQPVSFRMLCPITFPKG